VKKTVHGPNGHAAEVLGKSCRGRVGSSRALRAEIDEDVWSQLYRTTSRPFVKPETDKIAVKVINHYGDEVLNVYQV
jgi:hypothetical protein